MRTCACVWLVLCCWFGDGLSLRAQPVINEFLASNLSIYPDNCDLDDYSDWVELYNPAGTNVSLANHYLTDDLAQPFKWLIPGNPIIPANGYLMIRADGLNAVPGETRLRGYYPFGSTFVTKRYHAGFKLSADGEALGLYRTDLPPEETTLIATNAVWKYLDKGTDPGASWMSLAYDDSTWAQGPAELGYGEGDEATVVSYGSNAAQKYPTTHFRHTFTVSDPIRLGNIRFRLLADDGAIVFLNGSEVARVRMPAGAVTYTNYATSILQTEGVYDLLELSSSAFLAGTNIMAVEIHQAGGDSSDISFAAELIVSEVSGPAMLVDSVTFGSQATDVSYGRDPLSTNGWSFFGTPTPEGPNVTEPLTQLSTAPSVTASLPSGFYSGAQSVTLTSAGGAAIRYTLDGSVPGPGSALYSNTLTVTANTILRARALMSGLIPGPVLSRSYFLNEPAERTLPVVSFVAEPATLFDPVIGIYENNTPYPFKGREVPILVEFFETNRAPAFAVNGGVRIGGLDIWQYAQKPLNLHMRGKWGDDLVNYQVFPGEAVATFGKLNFRNGGDNWEKDMLRDALLAPLVRGQMQTDPVSYRPSVAFINGEYYGIHNIRKMFDAVFFANEHRLPEGTYDLVQYTFEPTFSQWGLIVLVADTGSLDAYEAFHAFYTTHDLAEATNYAAMVEKMNVDSFIDFVAAEDFGVNTSWRHNREFWCAHAPGSKWQFNIPDCDRCFDMAEVTGSLIGQFQSEYPLFEALANNTNFVDHLLQRYAAHLGSTFHSNRVITTLNTLSAEVDGEMPRHIARWGPLGGIPSMASRQAELDEIKQFAIARPAYALANLQSNLGINRGTAQLAVTLSPPAGGTVRLAGVPMTPQFNTTFTLFKNTPVELTAEPAPGYAFAGWSNGATNPTLELVLTGDQTITATFVGGAATVLPATLSADTVLDAAGSPYSAVGDVVVASNVTLTVGAGVRWLMPSGASIYVRGALHVNGSSNAPVEFLPHDGSSWGNLCFVNATGNSVLSNIFVRGATASRSDPVNLKAAISGYNSTLAIDGADIEAAYPVFSRFGSTSLRNSRIRITFTGDGINIKFGTGLVENCVFTGSPTPDTDGIDFDGVIGGVIRGNRVHTFRGFNSDAIDIGEGSQNLVIVSNRIYDVFDKGVSVGQASTVRIEYNLMVDCDMGVGIKDYGSTAHINRNTFARDHVGVAVYEKNVGAGGGLAYITNCIFSRSKTAPVTVDNLSSATVRYSLSDTLPLSGEGNLLADPLFTQPAIYDFSLTAASPAINAGDPAQPLEPDGTRVDMGASYVYSPEDYPYVIPHVVVLNEILAHSHDMAPDWIELYNQGADPLDIGGWYLSDDPGVLMKYRIADGTLLPGHGYLVFYQDLHFGAGSGDPGALVPFALSENGDTAILFCPGNGLRPDYLEREDFGPSATGVTFGRHYKASTRTYNFVAMTTPTPGLANSLPLTGPVVISEIMYHPPVADAEYIELANITTNPVTLFDFYTGVPWSITRGFTHTFPASPPLTLAAGERILLVRNSAIFAQNYSVPAGKRVFQWTAGALDNNGETLELSKPGDVDNQGVRQYVRVDRVDYTDTYPWPTGPDGSGTSLARINERAYGNDVANWTESAPTPGQTAYEAWLAGWSFPAGQDSPVADPDGDGLGNALEYALGLDPLAPSTLSWSIRVNETGVEVLWIGNANRPDATLTIQKAADGALAQWEELPTVTTPAGQSVLISAREPTRGCAGFYRLAVVLYNQ